MKILVCSLQVSSEGAKGHFIPAIEIALQAKKSGHDVALLPLPSHLGDDDVNLCKDLDIRFINPPHLPSGIIKNKDELAHLANDNTKTHLAFKSFLIDPLKFQFDAFREIVEVEKPDVVINDLLLYLPTIVSNKLSVKNYGYCSGFKLLANKSLTGRYKEYHDLLLPEINHFLKKAQANLKLRNLECLTEAGNFVFFPPELDIFDNEGNITCAGSLPNSLGSLDSSYCKCTKPYAVLSFGSVLDPFDYPEITENIIRICEEEGLHIFISTKKELGCSNITTMPYLPLHRLLTNASLYFHHGGANSFNEASRFGVPQILIALTTDQPIQANILKQLGHGFTLEKESITYQELKEVVTKFKDKNSKVNKKRVEIEKIFKNSNGAVSIIQKIERDFYRDNIYGEFTPKKKVFFPKSSLEVQSIINNANDLKERIYPISSAKSYGMGTKKTYDPNHFYMDLKYLKKNIRL